MLANWLTFTILFTSECRCIWEMCLESLCISNYQPIFKLFSLFAYTFRISKILLILGDGLITSPKPLCQCLQATFYTSSSCPGSMMLLLLGHWIFFPFAMWNSFHQQKIHKLKRTPYIRKNRKDLQYTLGSTVWCEMLQEHQHLYIINTTTKS